MVKGVLRTEMGTKSTPSPGPVEEEKINEVTADPENENGNDLSQNVKHVKKNSPLLAESVRNANHEYIRLGLHFESELIKHKLAFRYFDFCSFYFMFLPVTLIGTLITIIGFLISGVQNDEGSGVDDANITLLTGRSTQIWSLVVGILGAISTLFNSIGKRSNCQSQADVHKSAVKALEKLCMNVDFERDWFERNASDPEMAQESNLAADLKSRQASFKAMLDACCDSPVPYQVEQAFTVLEQVYKQQNGGELNNDGLEFYYHKLWKEHPTYWLWPLKSPSITISVKYEEWKDEMNKDLNADL